MQLGGVARFNPACRRVLYCSAWQLPEETSRIPKRSFSAQRSAQRMAGAESAVQRQKGPSPVPALPPLSPLNQGSPFPAQSTP